MALLNSIMLLWTKSAYGIRPGRTTQIHENMFQALQGSESGLVAYYRFDQIADATGSTTLYDLTSNGNHGTLTNMDAANDWVTASGYNTWIGSDDTAWSTAGNWSRNAVPGASDNVGVYGLYNRR